MIVSMQDDDLKVGMRPDASPGQSVAEVDTGLKHGMRPDAS